jgi:hypothetical protein
MLFAVVSGLRQTSRRAATSSAPSSREANMNVVPFSVASRWLSFVMNCPGRKPPFWTVTRPGRPYKSATQSRFTMGNAEGAYMPRAGPDRARVDRDAAREVQRDLGFGRIVASDIEVPNILLDLV